MKVWPRELDEVWARRLGEVSPHSPAELLRWRWHVRSRLIDVVGLDELTADGLSGSLTESAMRLADAFATVPDQWVSVMSNLVDATVNAIRPERPGLLEALGIEAAETVTYRVDDPNLAVYPTHCHECFRTYEDARPICESCGDITTTRPRDE